MGRSIAHALAASGADVVVNDVVAARAASVVDEVHAAGGRASVAVFDVTDHDAVRAAVAAIGGVDVLVSNAGNAGAGATTALVPFVETGPADWERYLQVNLYGVLHGCRAVLPGMIANGWGRIITVVSDAGRVGDPGLAAYSAAKAGAAGLSRALAAEVGRHGVTVNSVALGTMRTPLTEPLWSGEDDGRRRAVLRRYAIRRPGEPEDAAALVVFLASSMASWITGQTYPVNGGSSSAL